MSRKIVWLIIIVLRISLLSASLSTAQEDIWTDSFDDPGLPGWEHSPGVSVVDGVLRIEPGNFAARGGNWADFALSLSLRLTGPGGMALIYHVGEGGSHTLVLTDGGIELQRASGGQVISLSTEPQPMSQGEWHQLQLNVAGNVHMVMLDGVQVLNASDLDSPVREGGIYFETWGEQVTEVDNLTMTVGAALPQPTTDTQPEQVAIIEPGVWVRTGGPPGGIGYDIRYNFADPNIWYVTENYAGVHMSTDSGLTWQPSNNGIPPQSGPTGDRIPIFCLTVDPLNSQILWAGTDETGHIYKSVDGGHTWVEKDEGITIEYNALSFRGFTVDPRSSDIVYAMAETSSHTPTQDFTGGTVYKTVNGGDSWEKIWDGGMPSSLARYLWIDPRNPDVFFVSTGIFDRGAVGNNGPLTDPAGGLGVLKTTDGGQTWQILNAANGLENLFVGSLFMHPGNPDVLLAAVGHLAETPIQETWLQQGHSPAGVYRTENGGETWTQVLEPRMETIGESFSAVEICPSDSNIVYAGSNQTIHRSADAGVTWELVSGGPPDGWGPPGVDTGWPIDMQCDPRDPNRLFANNYGGGNFLSEDGGRTWQNASTGYTGARIMEVAVDALNPARVFGAGPGIWRSDDGGMTWRGMWFKPPDTPLGSNWTAIEFDPAQPERVLGANIWGPLLTESRNGGQSWQILWPDIVNGEPAIVPNAAIVDIAFAPSDPTRIYAGLADPLCVQRHEPCTVGNGGVLVSSDGGVSWTLVDHPSINGMPVFNLAVDPDNVNTVYAATEAGLMKSVDGGQTWTAVIGLPGENRVRAIAVSPTTPPRVLAGVDGHGVYVSTDGGLTWQVGIAGLEANGSLHDLLVDPTNPQIVYASDHSSGVYHSTDGGMTWVRINDGLRNRAGSGLAISADGKHLYLATDGEGVYRLDLNGQSPQ